MVFFHVKIWPRLVELAGEAGIGVLTAANGNAENSGNYYLEMFASWGAQDPYWIPVQVKIHDCAKILSICPCSGRRPKCCLRS